MRQIARRFGLFASMIAGLMLSAPATAAPVVATAGGKVSGLTRDSVYEYRHIPFAAPPIADLRWQPPQPPKPWTGVLDGTKFSGACPADDTLGVFGAPSDTEDCLYLNVTMPANGAGKKLPVLLWIPGGAFYDGSAADYDAAALARRGLVVVTINYRLGVLGFFAHNSVDNEGHAIGNYGLMDQQAAMRWVRNNIAKFGGDPGNVTLAGESAGGSSVFIQILSPGARGLFHRAINQSGSRMIVTTLDAARAMGDRFVAAVGCTDNTAACLRKLPVKTILDHQRALLPAVMVDGIVVPAQPGATILAGNYARVPLLTGFTSMEQAFGVAIREMTQGPLTPEGYAKDIVTFMGKEHADEIAAAYPVASFASPSEAEITSFQGARSCLSRWLAAASSKWAPTYAYEFDDRTAPSYFPPVSFKIGAYHTSDLQYLFPLFKGGLGTAHPLDAAQQKRSDEMIGYWANFARSGNPNGKGLREWPRYDPASDTVIALGSDALIKDYGNHYRCSLWDKVNKY